MHVCKTDHATDRGLRDHPTHYPTHRVRQNAHSQSWSFRAGPERQRCDRAGERRNLATGGLTLRRQQLLGLRAQALHAEGRRLVDDIVEHRAAAAASRGSPRRGGARSPVSGPRQQWPAIDARFEGGGAFELGLRIVPPFEQRAEHAEVAIGRRRGRPIRGGRSTNRPENGVRRSWRTVAYWRSMPAESPQSPRQEREHRHPRRPRRRDGGTRRRRGDRDYRTAPASSPSFEERQPVDRAGVEVSPVPARPSARGDTAPSSSPRSRARKKDCTDPHSSDAAVCTAVPTHLVPVLAGCRRTGLPGARGSRATARPRPAPATIAAHRRPDPARRSSIVSASASPSSRCVPARIRRP